MRPANKYSKFSPKVVGINDWKNPFMETNTNTITDFQAEIAYYTVEKPHT